MVNLHQTQSLIFAGEKIEQAEMGMVLVHGRGADAASILKLADRLDTSGFAILAPQASGNIWYPHRFLAPLAQNEPWLSSALESIENAVKSIHQAGIPYEKSILIGFSQGACLVLEYAFRNPRRYGGIVGLSGGLIGEDGLLRVPSGSLSGTPVFIGCSDIDFHIPRYRVEETAEFFQSLGGEVDFRLYSDMDHTVNEDELTAVQKILDRMRDS